MKAAIILSDNFDAERLTKLYVQPPKASVA